MKNLGFVILCAFVAGVIGCASLSKNELGKLTPFATLNPPADISPAKTNYNNGWYSPPKQRTAKEQAQLEKRLDWFHKSKYGLFFHFVAPEDNCTIQDRNKIVDAVDVEKFADQVKESGAGYVVLTLGQDQLYSCAPNPVLEKLWEMKPGSYISKRDLPSDLYKALHKRGIYLMFYIAAHTQYRLPNPPSFTKPTDQYENWLKVVQCYSDYYGKRFSGWWIDGLDKDLTTNYRDRMHEVIKHGNPDAITASGNYGSSEFTHGHCDGDWEIQQKYRKPYYGRWDPTYKIQWHALQYLGTTWGKRDVAHTTKSVVDYAADVVKGGGVITFEIGTFVEVNGKRTGTLLDIPEGQMAQLMAVKNAVKNIKPSDGSGR